MFAIKLTSATFSATPKPVDTQIKAFCYVTFSFATALKNQFAPLNYDQILKDGGCSVFSTIFRRPFFSFTFYKPIYLKMSKTIGFPSDEA